MAKFNFINEKGEIEHVLYCSDEEAKQTAILNELIMQRIN
jgi:hypothetical protein